MGCTTRRANTIRRPQGQASAADRDDLDMIVERHAPRRDSTIRLLSELLYHREQPSCEWRPLTADPGVDDRLALPGGLLADPARAQSPTHSNHSETDGLESSRIFRTRTKGLAATTPDANPHVWLDLLVDVLRRVVVTDLLAPPLDIADGQP
jgi:hypothetical protein